MQVGNRKFDYSKLCEQLDDLAMQILNIMQSIILERQYLDANCQDGFINMAKSRYLMRGQKIGVLQINTTNLTASKKVIANLDMIDDVNFTSFDMSEKGNSSDLPEKCKSHFDKANLKEASNTGDIEANTMERNGNLNSEEISLNNKSDPSSSVGNPLNWFGVLVPNSLKTCQARFEQAVETSVKIATFQSKLNSFCEEYRKLRKLKYISSLSTTLTETTA